MEQSKLFSPTLKETPNETTVKSQQLLLRAGYIRQVSTGNYAYLPLAYRVLTKLKRQLHHELAQVNAAEMMMPTLTATTETTPLQITDIQGRQYGLGAQPNAVLTDLVKDQLNSYKKLPQVLYHIQPAFQPEMYFNGLQHHREMLQATVSAFCATAAQTEQVTRQIEKAFQYVLTTCGLTFKLVQAAQDTTALVVLTDVGTQTIAFSTESDYAATVEVATSLDLATVAATSAEPLEKIATPGVKTIADVAAFLNVTPAQTVKSMLFIADQQPVLALVQGEDEVSTTKLQRALGAQVVTLATDDVAQQFLGANFGSLGPIGLPDTVQIIADLRLKALTNVVVGANQDGYHYQHANLKRDFTPAAFADLRLVREQELSPDGEGVLKFAKGVPVATLAKLGTRYSEAQQATFLDENGRSQFLTLGTYTFDFTNLFNVLAAQWSDEQGLTWPQAIAPFDIHVIPVNVKNKAQADLAETITSMLETAGYHVLLDDRQDRAGVKFADSDLIGIPMRITVGKKAEDEIVEIKLRRTGAVIEVQKSEVVANIEILLQQLTAENND